MDELDNGIETLEVERDDMSMLDKSEVDIMELCLLTVFGFSSRLGGIAGDRVDI
jgi:hypothetical protein